MKNRTRAALIPMEVKNDIATCEPLSGKTRAIQDPVYEIGGYAFRRADIDIALYLGYNAEDLKLFDKFRDPNARPQKGFISDIMGIRTRTSSLWESAQTLDGQLLGYPVPGSYHAETIEWLGLVKTVLSAKSRYIAMELGAGYGPWIVAGAVLARLLGIQDIHLTGVEGDPEHCRCMCQHVIDNGFNPDEHALHEAAVGAEAGEALWPTVANSLSEAHWGFRPIPTSGGDYMGRHFDKMHRVRVLAMADLVQTQARWDMVHIDIQGHEYDVCYASLADLNDRVKWLIISTHSRKIDGDLLDLFTRAGWVLEHEKPARFTFWPNPVSLEAMTTIDGTQVWQNPRLAG